MSQEEAPGFLKTNSPTKVVLSAACSRSQTLPCYVPEQTEKNRDEKISYDLLALILSCQETSSYRKQEFPCLRYRGKLELLEKSLSPIPC